MSINAPDNRNSTLNPRARTGDVGGDTRSGLIPGEGVAENVYDEETSIGGLVASSTYSGTPTVSTAPAGGLIGAAADLTPAQRAGIATDTDGYWENQGPGPRIMAADTLEGDKVVNATGEDLGELRDIMIDVPSGRVAYAVLSFGGFLGMGDKLFAIPWQALQLDTENHCFVLNVSKERLRDAPGFDKDHWPSMADQRWATDLHRYYETRPYWE